MNYWPGTKIPKSSGNAFDWRGASVMSDNKAAKNATSKNALKNRANIVLKKEQR